MGTAGHISLAVHGRHFSAKKWKMLNHNSIEYVIHYKCSACARWWSIGDGPTTGHIYCPRCGVLHTLKGEGDELNEEAER